HESLFESLPIAGESGTMKYFNSTKIKGKVHAKSGSAQGILNYAGYIEKDNGEMLAFSFFVNNYTGSRQQVRKEMVKVIESLL
ncbi:MAG: D-alanyl-D-alanine carboxypeptidase, partial [Chitinophagales bacterium]